MVGVDRHTGALIDNYASALQAVEVIFTTRIGERLMRRQFGGGLTELLGRAITPSLFSAWQLLLAVGIDLWEPRFRVRRVLVGGSVDAVRLGQTKVRIEVDWRPRGHLGDPTVVGTRQFYVGVVGTRLSVS